MTKLLFEPETNDIVIQSVCICISSNEIDVGRTRHMATSLLSIFILSCKVVSLICLFVSIHSYHWLRIENYSVNKPLIQNLCVSYGAFCNLEDYMPLPRIIILIPCVLTAIGLFLEIINLYLLCSVWQPVRPMLNFCLEQTSSALSCAITIHCSWVAIVHIRISMEMPTVHLDWTFFAFGLATLLVPLDCICSITRIMKNCQYEKVNQSRYRVQMYPCRHKSIMESDI